MGHSDFPVADAKDVATPAPSFTSSPMSVKFSPALSTSSLGEMKKTGGNDSLISARNKALVKVSNDTSKKEGVQAAVKKILSRKALDLKKETSEKIKAVENSLESHLKRLKIHRDLIRTMDKNIREAMAEDGDTSQLPSFEKAKEISVSAIKKILEQVAEDEQYLKSLNDAWDRFRQEYKDKVLLTVIKNEIRKQKDEKWNAYVETINWINFFPEHIKKEIDSPALLSKFYCADTVYPSDQPDDGHGSCAWGKGGNSQGQQQRKNSDEPGNAGQGHRGPRNSNYGQGIRQGPRKNSDEPDNAGHGQRGPRNANNGQGQGQGPRNDPQENHRHRRPVVVLSPAGTFVSSSTDLKPDEEINSLSAVA